MALVFNSIPGTFGYGLEKTVEEHRRISSLTPVASFSGLTQVTSFSARDVRNMAIHSSHSSGQMKMKYDVFVSFRGDDTRNNFVDHLYGALESKGIRTFRDDTMIKKGEPLSPSLLQAIEESKTSLVVFSKDYASSTWSLQELAAMVDCAQVSGKPVLPIFYDVDPSEVRKQSGNYQKAFEKHEQRFKDDPKMMAKVIKWRKALSQAANLCGWDIRDKPQHAEIENIVDEITTILGHESPSVPNDRVGMQSPLEELEELLHLDSVDDVRVLGICGKSGIGKTALATALYDRISHQYDVCCFIDDVSKTYQYSGPIGVQKQLLGQTLKAENLRISNLYDAANLIRRRLRHLRALIILDDVDEFEQLEKLADTRECLGAGSTIIIISRDEYILKVCGVDDIYKVPPLNWQDSIQLFCRKAFKCDDIMRDYEELTYDILVYADGLPRAIKVLGSFLFNQGVSEWRNALAKLRENPSEDIMNVLR